MARWKQWMGGVALGLLMTPGSLWAGTKVALLNLTARGVDGEQALVLSRTLRESLMLDGRFEVVDELAMYEQLAGRDGALRLKQARTLLADAKKAYREKDFTGAVQKLDGSRALHRTLYSELSRPDELADLLLFQGLAQFQLGRPDEARLTFMQMFLMHPGVQVQRAPGLTADLRSALEESRQQSKKTPLKGLNSRFAGEIAQKLGVEQLITGVVEGDLEDPAAGVTLSLQVMTAGRETPASFKFALDDLSEGVPPAGAPVFKRVIGVTERVLEP